MTNDTISETSVDKTQYVRLGNTGLKVSKICLGMMSYGIKEWAGDWVLTEEEALPVIGKALELGINFWDTANGSIKKFNIPRDRIVIATKVRGPGWIDKNRAGLSRKCILQEVEGSLERLGEILVFNVTDRHSEILNCNIRSSSELISWDYDVPIEETMSTLHDLVRIGKVRYIGVSSMYAWQFSKAQYTAKMNGWETFVSMQNLYNLTYREEEREMIPMLQDLGVGMIPWSPLAAGLLTGKIRGTQREKRSQQQFKPNEVTEQIIDRTIATAEKKGISPSQVALSWMYTKKFVHSPIVGISKLKYLYDVIGALDVKLTEDEIKYLEEPYQPTRVFGHY
ncbi:oxidoreductase [Gonapodya prolifera JEL478]|uniref:Oxidoreductase n=1 Tax=Gonapodya prolifera (strain JEL478) TaxID=1344416 RepID=A0A139AKA7_GONPJ|nr:oxidoreductase [Gonapodya prolifera JEL478]|eukprot:KXS17210.1 oxidoreductase [Gonapodya prolifera JEL478]